jgi:hypothetical protein
MDVDEILPPNRPFGRHALAAAWMAGASLALVVGLTTCGGATSPADVASVLFVGNSLTQANDLPEMVRTLAVLGGHAEPVIGTVLRGGYSLGDHLTEGTAPRAIAAEPWSIVILQQGPSGLPESRVQLVADARQFDAIDRNVGARTGLYMVWPDITRKTAFDSVSLSYRTAAAAVGGLLFAVGDAWQAAWRRDSTLPLYGSDGFHPSVEGSYLAALVIYAGLYRDNPVGLPARFTVGTAGWTLDVPPAHAQVLQAAAAEVAGLAGPR